MTQRELMLTGGIYDPTDPELAAEQAEYSKKLFAFNSLPPEDMPARERYYSDTFASVGEGCYIEPPFHANWGGKNLHVGKRFYANFNFTAVDDADIFIGDNVLIGPNVTIATACHPIDPEPRRKGLQYNRPVHIGDNVWIGAGAIILPGVTVGENSVIGAGSVVTKDIPAKSVAVGNPCRVIRTVNENT